MALNFKARVLLELGAELISSDAVALYELVKNGIDAGSKSIYVDIVVALQPSIRRSIERTLLANKVTFDSAGFIELVDSSLEPNTPDPVRAQFLKALGAPSSATKAISALVEASFKFNSISIRDKGHGMTRTSLDACYLTIGTPMRLHERDSTKTSSGTKSKRTPLGEKGIGRLAAMRLGHHVEVLTGVSGESNQSRLDLDWRPVFADPDLDSSALDFKVQKGPTKPLKNTGTEIRIRDLQSDWTKEKLEALSLTELSKIADPFRNNTSGSFLEIQFQGKELIVPGFPEALLRYADAVCTIEYRVSAGSNSKPEPRLSVSTDYRQYKRAETLVHEGPHLNDLVANPLAKRRKRKEQDPPPVSEEINATLESLGPFSARFHWFNRGRLKTANHDLWADTLEPFVRTWSGGLLVYRDGFRVYPYGGSGDDWLDLDRKALSASAYKLNRAQIIGYLRITSTGNPYLHDQTNREGFRDSPEKDVLRRLLRQAIIADCRTFLEKVDRENKVIDPSDVGELDRRVNSSHKEIIHNLRGLESRIPEESSAITEIMHQLAEVEEAWGRAKETIAAHEDEVEQYIHLAGVGLMVELIAHELARSTDEALHALASKRVNSAAQIDVLKAELTTINRRVRVLDELSVPGRQRKTVNDVRDIVETMVDFYTAKAKRHHVAIKLNPGKKGSFRRRVEKGQVMQILDNLLNNAIYWLDRRVDRDKPAAISIAIDAAEGAVTVADNGPGISVGISARVFDAFYTTKSQDGRGLGLYIARKLASDNDMTIELLPAVDGVHRGFELRFKEKS